MDLVFVNGIVKSKEKNLIGTRKFSQLIEAEDYFAAVKLLSEFGFGEKAEDKEDYEALIDAEQASFVGFLREFSPSERFFRLATAKNDFHNAEVAVRKHNSCADGAAYAATGSVSREKLEKAAAGKAGEAPDYLAEPMRAAEEIFKRGNATGAEIGTVFVKAYYAYMKKYALGKDFKESVVFEIGAKNISTAVRCGDYKKAERLFIAGGEVSEEVLLSLCEKDWAKALDKAARTPYAELIRLAESASAEGKPLVAFERAAEGFSLKKLKEKRFETEGILPLLLYTLYKRSEMQNVRIILALKKCGAEKEKIRERLRECYAG